MFFTLIIFIFSSLISLELNASISLPDNFVSATIKLIQVEKPLCRCAQKKQGFFCHKCSEYQYIKKEYDEELYHFIFALNQQEETHILHTIDELRYSTHIKKELLSALEIYEILHLSPQQYQDRFYPEKEKTIKKSPAQKRQEKAIKNSEEKNDHLRDTRSYHSLLSAIQEAIDSLLLPNTRIFLEKNFVTNRSFRFNHFIQYYEQAFKSDKKIVLKSKKTDHLDYFSLDKYGNHRFYIVQARTIHLFKKILKLYLKNLPNSSLHQFFEQRGFPFSEKKRKINETLQEVSALLKDSLTQDLPLISKETDLYPLNFHVAENYKGLLIQE